ncbi:DUF2834 domain-containing protein [Periweissella cryptocerci]|uniref:DUF2834 domain-containing protein n=1 Tax=Periweissella cryptocerci TaxID=2506420 RepID=A0A4P6YX42_9LACO|nr:DUF2834 domain-containing protein [Periweissella cryptocerci]QBO37391.1 DUF2834 domain-containing protein [Periweissella cryptocerci]
MLDIITSTLFSKFPELSQHILASDPFTKTTTLLQTWTGRAQVILTVGSVLAAVVTAIVYIFSGDEGKRKVRKHWLAIAVAIIVGFSAAVAISFLQTQVSS